jgi:hypothetical protein
VAEQRTRTEKIEIEPQPKNPEFFEWFETLFDGTTQFPEKIHTCVVTGPNKERLGPVVTSTLFGPEQKLSKKTKVSAETAEAEVEEEQKREWFKGGKPTREELVAYSNMILNRCQQMCEATRKSTVFGVHVAHFSRDDDFYERYLLRCQPKQVTKGERGEDIEEDAENLDGMSARDRYAIQALQHDERMFNMYGAGIEGLLDRQDRALEREALTNERLRLTTERQQEIIERLQSNSLEREMARDWNNLKIKSVEKGIALVTGLAPPIINQIAGRKVVPTEDTAESLTLKSFFKLESDGGTLTTEQADKAFGTRDDKPPHDVLTRGVLSPDQVTLLLDVAFCRVKPDVLDQLIEDGPLKVSMEQAMELQGIFSQEQIAPIMALLMLRMHNAKKISS